MRIQIRQGPRRIPPAVGTDGGGRRILPAAKAVGGGGRRDGVRHDGPPATGRGWRGFAGGSRGGVAGPPAVDPARGRAGGGRPVYDDTG